MRRRPDIESMAGRTPPHRDGQVVSGERVLPEVDHEKPADAVDEIGKIFAEIETRASGHECEIPADSGSTLLWAGLRDVKGGPGWMVCAVSRIVLPSAPPRQSVAFTTIANASIMPAANQACCPAS